MGVEVKPQVSYNFKFIWERVHKKEEATILVYFSVGDGFSVSHTIEGQHLFPTIECHCTDKKLQDVYSLRPTINFTECLVHFRMVCHTKCKAFPNTYCDPPDPPNLPFQV
jgi:hypothetical protein